MQIDEYYSKFQEEIGYQVNQADFISAFQAERTEEIKSQRNNGGIKRVTSRVINNVSEIVLQRFVLWFKNGGQASSDKEALAKEVHNIITKSRPGGQYIFALRLLRDSTIKKENK